MKRKREIPEGGCLTLMAMWTMVIVFALFCSWFFPMLKQKIDHHEKVRTCIVDTPVVGMWQ